MNGLPSAGHTTARSLTVTAMAASTTTISGVLRHAPGLLLTMAESHEVTSLTQRRRRTTFAAHVVKVELAVASASPCH